MNYGDFDRDGAEHDPDARYGDARRPEGPELSPRSTGRLGGDPFDEPTTRSVTGRASVGDQLRPGGAFGLSSGAGPVKPGAPAGRASVGRASVGRAVVPEAEEATGSAGHAPVPAASVPAASVPANGAGVVGRATVGRASVRAAAPVAPVVPGVPGGPGGPPGSGPDVIQGPGPGRRPPAEAPRPRTPRSKRARRRNWIIAAFATFIMLAGGLVVGGTYYFQSVPLPENLALPESTTIFYSDGKTPLAKIGTANRTLITSDKIKPWVEHAVIAAEDRSFYDNKGVDFKGILRAAWNNVTGGERQGASTITQQYARNVAELEGISYARKIKEAVIATKLTQKYSKKDIMRFYLNTVYFGRQAYGIEAAARAYFNKSAEQLDTAEAVVLAGLIKNPEGDGVNGSPYDPTRHKETAVDRWNYIRDGMVELKDKEGKPFLTKEEAAALKYPQNVIPIKANDPQFTSQSGLDKPTGLVVHHVMDELKHMRNPDGTIGLRDKQGKELDIKNGGLKIVTTIDVAAQAAAEAAADETRQGSLMFDQPKNLQAALVAVEAGTGRVRAYYGASNGAGFDMAGWYNDPVLADGTPSGGSHPAGSTFKVYTLGAALKAGISIDSYWLGPKTREFKASGRVGKGAIRNSGDSCPDGCTLAYALEKSMNTVYFAVGEKVGAAKVIDFARAAGIRSMWASVPDKDEKGNQTFVLKRIDLTAIKSGAEVAPKYFSTEVSIGQYHITVMDHANGVATLAARGKAAEEHFVQQVSKGNDLFYNERIAPKQIDGYTEAMADDEAFAMQQVVKSGTATAARLNGGRPAAGKTGTWQLGDTTDNAHAWFVGFTASDLAKNQRGLAAAVWVGNKGVEQKIVDKNKKAIGGGNLPAQIWKKFMDATLAAQKAKIVNFPDPKFVGDDTGEVASPAPSAPPGDPGNPNDPTSPKPCQLPVGGLCPSIPGGGGGGPLPPSHTRTPRR
jgi:membrane peptidoglycan carboxypeptidase